MDTRTQAKNLSLLRLELRFGTSGGRNTLISFRPICQGANLSEMDLRRADLTGADLRKADLGGARLLNADLYMARVGGADLRRAQGLTSLQIAEALGDQETLLPANFQRPSHWTARVTNLAASLRTGTSGGSLIYLGASRWRGFRNPLAPQFNS